MGVGAYLVVGAYAFSYLGYGGEGMPVIVDTWQKVQSEGTSKGNQSKFFQNGVWVKFDTSGNYEGLAEEFASLFAKTILGFPIVEYHTETFEYDSMTYNGCYSYSMYNGGAAFVSLRRLFKMNGISLDIFTKHKDISQNIQEVIITVYRLTGLNISEYLFRVLFYDCLIQNEDRHYMNLGVCWSAKHGWVEAPCFDNGGSLFCVNWTYRDRLTFAENFERVQRSARPFSKFFNKQIEACMLLGAKPLKINRQAVRQLLDTYENPRYSNDMVIRVKTVLFERLRMYEGKVFEWV